MKYIVNLFAAIITTVIMVVAIILDAPIYMSLLAAGSSAYNFIFVAWVNGLFAKGEKDDE